MCKFVNKKIDKFFYDIYPSKDRTFFILVLDYWKF